jgi:hypothetical protein
MAIEVISKMDKDMMQTLRITTSDASFSNRTSMGSMNDSLKAF